MRRSPSSRGSSVESPFRLPRPPVTGPSGQWAVQPRSMTKGVPAGQRLRHSALGHSSFLRQWWVIRHSRAAGVTPVIPVTRPGDDAVYRRVAEKGGQQRTVQAVGEGRHQSEEHRHPQQEPVRAVHPPLQLGRRAFALRRRHYIAAAINAVAAQPRSADIMCIANRLPENPQRPQPISVCRARAKVAEGRQPRHLNCSNVSLHPSAAGDSECRQHQRFNGRSASPANQGQDCL